MSSSRPTAILTSSQHCTQIEASLRASSVRLVTSYSVMVSATSSIRSRMSSMVVISLWISSRSSGVMKVLCSRSMVSCVIRSAFFSVACTRRAWASALPRSLISVSSSRDAVTAQSACWLKYSKNLPSVGMNRPNMAVPCRGAQRAVSLGMTGLRERLRNSRRCRRLSRKSNILQGSRRVTYALCGATRQRATGRPHRRGQVSLSKNAGPPLKLSNLVNWPRKVSRTVPIGPLRCLPMMISAVPLSCESGL
ncbi:hypothetical protein OJJOAM_003111 [Cupriavidus sp. H18C1]